MTSLYRPLGNTGYTCHPLGFGSYRINEDNPTHERALRSYIQHGGNLIDTSANYGDGASETLIGKILSDINRSKMIVVSKGGYIQGQNLALAQKHDFPEVIKVQDNLWHCIHPEFLETQITRSLQRLQSDYIDIYLLHNPEYFINHQSNFGPLDDTVHDAFYRRVRRAFEYLESQVALGRIRYYGISSNNFGYHAQDRARTDVSRCWAMAEEVSPHHHFRVVQMPMNPYEAGGAIYPTQNGLTPLEFCIKHNIGVLINRPLNAFHDNRLIRIADYVTPGQNKPDISTLRDEMQPLINLENEFKLRFNGSPFGDEEQGLVSYLLYIADDLPSKEHWNTVIDRYIVPPVTQWLRDQSALYSDSIVWNAWQENFVKAVNLTLDRVEKYVAYSDQKVSDRVRQRLMDSGYPSSDASLSQMALSLLIQTQGVSCVLNGMRTESYVKDAMGALDLPAVDAKHILERFDQSIR
ncbi:MAG TPA: aldo/keto reductase [bacterium]|nr:aldo/keto reductase [bacterium]HMY34744.1 aldo/keto reductase [bacterium]HMZ03079.1 aldo/keto reductase [bacterium]HNB08159.1 aldo/keto reductase [bacterium]HNB56745.1 aldo/keto reductase [bacterium]